MIIIQGPASDTFSKTMIIIQGDITVDVKRLLNEHYVHLVSLLRHAEIISHYRPKFILHRPTIFTFLIFFQQGYFRSHSHIVVFATKHETSF